VSVMSSLSYINCCFNYGLNLLSLVPSLNVKTVLLYGSETWRTTKATCKRLQVFINILAHNS
jgi:hypothetical protein